MEAIIYPSDLTETQWELLESLLPAPKTRGRPPTPARQILNAIFYVLRSGCQWRFLPKEFGPWETVYGRFRQWRLCGLWTRIHDQLRARVRGKAGKRSRPTAAILDSQTVRSADHAGERGYDAAKKTKGRKRHVLVDTLGLLLGVCVTPADVSEREGAQKLLERVLGWFAWLRVLWVDNGYCGPAFAQWVRGLRPKLSVQVVKRRAGQRGFTVLPRRWVVERTFGWLMKQRRLVRDYEVRLQVAETWVTVSMIRIMLRRLA